MRLKLSSTSAILGCFLATTQTAHADGVWTLGLFASVEDGLYANSKDEAEVMPYFAYDTERFHFGLDGIAYHAVVTDAATLSFLLSPRMEPNYPKGPVFAGLKRDAAVELGFDGQYNFGSVYIGASGLFDISDTHNGYELSTKLGYGFESGAFSLDANVGVRHRSKELNQYLFGVSPAEATAARAAFQAGKTTTAIANISAAYALSDQLSLISDISVEEIGNTRNSPLANNIKSNTSLAVGMVFKF